VVRVLTGFKFMFWKEREVVERRKSACVRRVVSRERKGRTNVIEMEVVQVLSVDEEVEHVESLSADLKTGLYPIESRRLEAVLKEEEAQSANAPRERLRVEEDDRNVQLGVLEGSEQVPLGLRLRVLVLESVEDVDFELSRENDATGSQFRRFLDYARLRPYFTSNNSLSTRE